MLAQLGTKWRYLRRKFDSSEWAAKYIYPAPSNTVEHGINSPGILILQIDGLGYEQMLDAIDKKRLPFLQRLVQRDQFVLRQFYSGLPSTTPAVQAELFYGVKTAVPAFKYYDRTRRRVMEMFSGEAVDAVARRMEETKQGLLLGGSSYSNIYAGGADEAPFCIQSMQLESIYHGFKLRKVIWFFTGNIGKLFRIIGLSFLEFALACSDFFRGLITRRKPFKEFIFIFSRIGVAIILRELIRLRVKVDIVRGLPVIHANFIGYDEHAHRRGPGSSFALWTLKGIDSVIRDLVRKAVTSDRRDYQIVIYSDHGQESTVAFEESTGRTLRASVGKVFSKGSLQDCEIADLDSIIPHLNLHRRSMNLLGLLGKNGRRKLRPDLSGSGTIHITAMGPLGHIYLPRRPGADEMIFYAKKLVREAGIPLVFHVEGEQVICTSRTGSQELSTRAADLFGSSHPFLDEIAEDMRALCTHEHAGEFIISGWLHDQAPLTFAIENGSHGGPGTKETRGFVIVPEHLLKNEQKFFRPLDLRQTIQGIFVKTSRFSNQAPPACDSETLKVMTYNVHSCLGTDGKLFPERIARIIHRQAPDIVALQELDRNLARSARQDQITLLGERLGMSSVFFPLREEGDGEYGLAVLSRYPVLREECTVLPRLPLAGSSEERGLMHLVCNTRSGPVHVLNTHLGLGRRERIKQMRWIVENYIKAGRAAGEPTILCGDLNSGVNSPSYRLLSENLSDAQMIYPDMQPDSTFFSTWPLLRLDHIFHSSHLVPVSIAVINDWECRLASDHLPVSAVFVTQHRLSGAAA